MSQQRAIGRPDEVATKALKRPEAITLSVEDLLDFVQRGKVRVSAFQRGLCWAKRNIDELLDSIYRGYPIGYLLLWKKPAEVEIVQVGPVRIDAPARNAPCRWPSPMP